MHLSLSGIFLLPHYLPLKGWEGGILSTIVYTGRLRVKGVPFFSLQVYEREGVLLVEVYERVGKSVISVCERAQKGSQIRFKAL